MRQAILYGAGDLRIEDRPLDSQYLAPGEVYVETLASALSTGTDLGNYLGDSDYVPGAFPYPRPVGYSNVGRIMRAGASVATLREGARVFSLRPHQSAFIAKESDLLVEVPDGLAAETASLAYLTQLGLAALRQARYQAGEEVAVIGLGVIGLCTVATAKLLGARVTAVANSEDRAELALHLGAHHATITSLALPDEFADVVVLTANTWEAYRTSVTVARHGGRIAVLGFPGRGQSPPPFNPLDPAWFYKKQLVLIGAGRTTATECPPDALRFNLRRNLEYILQSMANGSLRLDAVISHRIQAERMRDAYELAREHDKSLTAAVFLWR